MQREVKEGGKEGGRDEGKRKEVRKYPFCFSCKKSLPLHNHSWKYLHRK